MVPYFASFCALKVEEKLKTFYKANILQPSTGNGFVEFRIPKSKNFYASSHAPSSQFLRMQFLKESKGRNDWFGESYLKGVKKMGKNRGPEKWTWNAETRYQSGFQASISADRTAIQNRYLIYWKRSIYFFDHDFTRSIRDFSKNLHVFTPVDMTFQKYHLICPW